MAARRRFVLSTVGISVLTKSTSESLWDVANDRTLPDSIQVVAMKASENAMKMLRDGAVADRRQLSAELNGLYGLYDDRIELGQNDVHMLLVTDTDLGEMAGAVLINFLRDQGWSSIDCYAPRRLTTATADEFSQGMKNLINWCEEIIPGYQRAGYEIIFNLTGGFKSLQGYLTIVGMFYADRIVTIFETANELLTIPHLPIDLDKSVFQDNRVALALMAEGDALLPTDQVTGIPDGLLETLNGRVGLSNWGLLAWNRLQSDILRSELLDFPRLRYTSTFRKDFDKADKADREALQCTLAQVSALLAENNGDVTVLKRHTGLQYKNYRKKRTSDDCPIGHFYLDQGRRVSCVMRAEGTLQLRHFGEHDKVNDAP